MSRLLERILIGVFAFSLAALVGFIVADLLSDMMDTKKDVEPEA
jgi:hypothetical protein